MANRHIDAVFSGSASKGGARLVLLTLADRANDAGECWPSIADIARRAGVSPRQAQRHVAALVALGELAIVRRGGGIRPGSNGDAGLTTVYRVALPVADANPVTNDTVSTPNPVTDDTVSTGRNPDIHGRKPRHPRRETLTPTVETLTSKARNPVTRDRGTLINPQENPKRTPREPGAAAPQAAGAADGWEVVESLLGLTSELRSDEFRTAWTDWAKHRRELRKRLTPSTVKAQLGQLESMGRDNATKSIRQSIEKGWTGLFDVADPAQRESASSIARRGATLPNSTGEKVRLRFIDEGAA